MGSSRHGASRSSPSSAVPSPSSSSPSSTTSTSSSSSSSPIFEITTHVIALPTIRETIPDVVLGDDSLQEGGWRLSVKQYTPLDRVEPGKGKGEVTVLAAGGNGYVKELYEPLWEDLYHALKRKGISIRSIWIADQANMGESARLNRHLLNDPVSTFDHSRDLLHLVSLFPQHFQHPIIGIGHSAGATQLTNLSLIHPTLLRSLILLDPIFVSSVEAAGVKALIAFALQRKTRWKSQAEAEAYFKRAWKRWDKRAIEKWMEFALESDGNGGAKLAWERQQELMAYIPFQHPNSPRAEGDEQKKLEPEDFVPWPYQINGLLPIIAPSTLVLCGATSPSAQPESRDDWQRRIGSDPTFRGFKTNRNVKVEALEGKGHLFPMEAPTEVAVRVSEWIGDEVGEGSAWQRESEEGKRWRGMSLAEKEKVSKLWMDSVKSRL